MTGPAPAGRRTTAGRAETAEREWVAWLDAVPELVLPAAGRAVVLAAHPDDETLGAGGILQRLASAGWEVTLVLATDGEAAYGGDDLGPTRVAELRAALGRLGLGIEPVRLRLPDREVAAHEDEIVAALPPADLLLAPYRHDGHRDHDACGRAAARHAATGPAPAPPTAHTTPASRARTSAHAGGRGVLLEYPVWAWHWSRPEEFPWERARKLTLGDSEWARKQDALGAYGSQDGILPEPVLAHFRRRVEVLLG